MKNAQNFITGIHDYLERAFKPVATQLAELRADVAELRRSVEATQNSVNEFRYKGVHEPGTTYRENNSVTYGGSVWVCVAKQTTQRPGDGSDWSLAVKRGRDGRDMR